MDPAMIEALGLNGQTGVRGPDLHRLIDPEANLNVDGSLTLTRRTLRALREYSASLPTGTRAGKVWKHRNRRTGELTLGRFGEPYPKGHRFHGEIPIGWYRIRVRGQEPCFPRDVRVPPEPMRGRCRDHLIGDQT